MYQDNLTFLYLMLTSISIVTYCSMIICMSKQSSEKVLSLAEAKKQIEVAQNETRTDKRLRNFSTYWAVTSLFKNRKDVGEKIFQILLLFSNLHIIGLVSAL